MGDNVLMLGRIASIQPDSQDLVASRAPDMANLAALAEEVARRCPMPIDAYEVAAVLESLGVIDGTAQRRYAAADTFALAASVLATLREAGLAKPVAAVDTSPQSTWRSRLSDYARGPQAVGVIAVLILALTGASGAGGWGEQQILAISLGMSGSMLATNGFVQAASRRSAIYLSRSNIPAARAFLALIAYPVLSAVYGLGALVAILLALVWNFSLGELALFGIAYGSLALIWLVAAILSLVERSGVVGLALIVGLCVGAAVDRAASFITPAHLLIGGLGGYVVALSLMIRSASGPLTLPKQSRERPSLPSSGYLLVEAAPYFMYGLAYMAFIFLPHLLGSLGAVPAGASRSAALASVEIGLTLSLLPLLLVGGVLEHTARQLWRATRVALLNSSSSGVFVQHVRAFLRRELRVYLATIALVSVTAAIAFFLADRSRLLEPWVSVTEHNSLQHVFYMGLIAYGLLGWALFNCMLCVALGRPTFALPPIIAGCIVQLVVGALVVWGIDYRYVGIAFIAGAATLLVVSLINTRGLVNRIDYYYQSSF